MFKDHSDQRTELERLTPGLRRYARALVARDVDDSRLEADALTSETLARAMRADHGARIQSQRIWLYATLTTLNRARARRQPPREKSASPDGKPAGRGVSDALDALPLDHREALLLVVLEGFTYGEAGDALGLSRAAVGARIARARSILDQRLDAAQPADARKKQNPPPYLRLVE